MGTNGTIFKFIDNYNLYSNKFYDFMQHKITGGIHITTMVYKICNRNVYIIINSTCEIYHDKIDN